MPLFLSCDWGSSRFRLRLVDSESLAIIETVETRDGISALFSTLDITQRTANGRAIFFTDYLSSKLSELQSVTNQAIDSLPLIVSGMASANIGLRELGYRELPVRCDGSDLVVVSLDVAERNSATLLVSGCCTDRDVMRGEETLLAGIVAGESLQRSVCLFPGTHSKHVFIENGMAIDIQTYMTGELFELLSTKSVLAASLTTTIEKVSEHTASFWKGVRDAQDANLLNAIFRVRTNHLLHQADGDANRHYLSGLLIGQELRGLVGSETEQVILVGTGALLRLYEQAISVLGIYNAISVDADEALVRGQWRILSRGTT